MLIIFSLSIGTKRHEIGRYIEYLLYDIWKLVILILVKPADLTLALVLYRSLVNSILFIEMNEVASIGRENKAKN